MGLHPNHLRLMMIHVANDMIAAEALLAGAGREHRDEKAGTDMIRGMEVLKEQLNCLEAESIEQVFASTGVALIQGSGGETTAIFNTLFISGSRAVANTLIFNTHALVRFLKGALGGVSGVSTDKALIGALASAAAKAEELIFDSLERALTAATVATETGTGVTRSTISIADRGRDLGQACARFPGPRTLCLILILRSMRDFVLFRGESPSTKF